MPEFRTRLVTEGLGFGLGDIDGSLESDPETAQKLDKAIQSPELLTAVDINEETGKMLDDDACGDGREVNFIVRLGHRYKRSLHRSKVFGGGATMAAAISIGTGRARNDQLVTVFTSAADRMTACKIDFGGHTADHAAEGSCGCGAIDSAPKIVASAVNYETEIRGSLATLGMSGEQIDGKLDTIFANFRTTASATAGQNYSGYKVMDALSNVYGKVIKQLGGSHLEKAIILNTLNGYTTNQQFVRTATGDKAQVFAVDAWRLQDIANRLNTDDQTGEVNESAAQDALLSELVYTLATAAVLTKGNLPVYLTESTELATVA